MLRCVSNGFAAVLLSATGSFAAAGATPVRADSPQHSAGIVRQLLSQPLAFESNDDPSGRRSGYVSRGAGYAFLVEPRRTVTSLRATDGRTLDVVTSFVGACADAKPVTAGTATRFNYLIGRDPKNWRIDVASFKSVRYNGLYPGIDVVHYGNQQQLEYDFVVHPDGDPHSIRMHFDGAQKAEITAAGDLVLRSEAGDVAHKRPVAYQIEDGQRVTVAAMYRKINDREVALDVGPYDGGIDLVIDPTLAFSTFFGNAGDDQIHGLAVDPAGNVYIGGRTHRSPWLATPGAMQTTNPGAIEYGTFDTLTNLYDGFVSKISSDGTTVFTTFLGGMSNDVVWGVGVDSSGNVVVGGETASSDFPTTSNALIASLPKGFGDPYDRVSHGFVARLNPTGSSFVYSTYLGGNSVWAWDRVTSLTSDAAGNAYVIGETESTDLPVSSGAYQPTINSSTSWNRHDGFVAKLDPSGARVYLTYLGGPDYDRPEGIAVDSAGNAYIRTRTSWLTDLHPETTHFPVTPGAWQTGRYFEYYVSKLNASGTALVYSTGLGGNRNPSFFYDPPRPGGIAVGSDGCAYVTGYTDANTGLFQTTPGAYLTSSTCGSAFVAKLTPDGSSAVYSTLVNAAPCTDGAVGNAIAVDSAGNAYITGNTQDPNFPMINAIQSHLILTPCSACDGDAFVTQLDPSGMPVFSTALGSTAIDEGRLIAVSGTSSVVVAGQHGADDDLSAGSPVFWSTNMSNASPMAQHGKGFVTKIDMAGTPPARTITDVVPVAEANVDNQRYVGIRGQGFDLDQLTTSPGIIVRDGVDTYAYVSWVDPTMVYLEVPSLPEGTYEVGLKFVDGSILRYNGLRVMTFPTVAGCGAPLVGPTTGGTTFTINGSGFKPGVTVAFGSQIATNVTLVSPTQLSVVTPPNLAGGAPVTIMNPDGGYVALNDVCWGYPFVYQDPVSPTITSVSPDHVSTQGGALLTITGTNFTGAGTMGLQHVVSPTTIQSVNGGGVGETDVTVYKPGSLASPAKLAAGLTYVAEPAITPPYGPIAGGTAVTIKGNAFQQGAEVFFNDDRAASVNIVDASTIVAVSPPRLTPGDSNYAHITVRNPNGLTWKFQYAFWYAAENAGGVSVTGVSPATGSTAGGDTITITGTGFTVGAIEYLLIGGLYSGYPATVNPTSFSIKTPPHVAGPVDIVIVFRAPGSPVGVLHGGYTYTPAPPSVTSVTPPKGVPDGGTAITINGSSFTRPGAVATIGGSALVNPQVARTTQITGTTPAHAAGAVAVVVTNPDGQTSTLPNAYTYGYPNVTLTPATPTVMPLATQTMTVTLEFALASDATLDLLSSDPSIVTVPATVTITAGSTSATFNATATATAGTATVTATLRSAPGSTPGTSTITVPPAPAITSFNPTFGGAGTAVTITGVQFTGATAVTFGTVAATFTVASATQINATVPTNALTGPITITGPGGTGTSTATFYVPARFGSSPFTPSSGVPGTSVVITGQNFQGATAVTFGGVAVASFTVNTAGTSITTTVPVTSTGPVAITTPAGTVTSSVNFVIPCQIDSFTPTQGAVGTTVTISGRGFTGASAVKFGGSSGTNATSFTVVSDTSITAVAPAADSGPICITTAQGTGCSSGSFSLPPRITGFTPASALPGVSVTINGSNFQGATAVSFNGVAASTFTVSSDGKSITATVPATALTGFVTVTTPIGSGTSAVAFGVPPAITSFTPTTGGSATVVTITGVRFTGATAVAFTGGAATTFTVVSDTTINATTPAAVSTGPISVTTPGGTGTSSASFVVGPKITSFTPAKGTAGTTVTITGVNFTGITDVKFGGVSASSFTVVSATSITAVVPTGALTGPISVVSALATGTSSAYFYLPITVTSFTPTSGPGGTVVAITGTGLTGVNRVTINGMLFLYVTVVSGTQVRVTVPTLASSGPLVVSNPYWSVQTTTSFTVTAGPPPTYRGDASGDGVVDVADIFYLIRYLYAGGTAPIHTADANNDGKVNVADVFFLINYVFSGGPAPAASLPAQHR